MLEELVSGIKPKTSKPGLTKRELEVLIAASMDEYSGHFIPHVAGVLVISEMTTKNHLRNIRKKFGVYDTFPAVYHALYYRFISVDAAKEADIKSKLAILTDREREVLTAYGTSALDKGYVTKNEVAQTLGISPFTLGKHITHIYDKLGIHNNAQLAVFAYVHLQNTRHQATQQK